MLAPERRFPVLALLACLAVGALVPACTESPSEPAKPVDLSLTLAAGQTSAVAGTALTLRFVGVTNDSRCPADALCILGGSATVVLEVSSNGGSTQRIELQTGDNKPASYDRFTLAIVELSPYPFSARPIEPGEYRLTLRITG